MMTKELVDNDCFVALTHEHLDVKVVMDRVRSPKAGATVLFAGTTRDNFAGREVKQLKYTAYEPRALKTMLAICKDLLKKYALTKVAMIHRLGIIPICEESILIAISCPHRKEAWWASQEALEKCKEKVEVWKQEEFEGNDMGQWKANRDDADGTGIDEEELSRILSR